MSKVMINGKKYKETSLQKALMKMAKKYGKKYSKITLKERMKGIKRSKRDDILYYIGRTDKGGDAGYTITYKGDYEDILGRLNTYSGTILTLEDFLLDKWVVLPIGIDWEDVEIKEIT
jgi:hypothetical protein